MSTKVGFLTTHPIQYQVPLFRLLEQSLEIDLTVFYCMLPDQKQQGAGFGVEFEWDVPLLDGYKYVLLNNVAKEPGVTHYKGCDTPELANVLKERNIEILIVNGWVVKSCLQGLRAARRLGIPCVVRGEANSLRPRAWWKNIGHRVLVNRYAACLYIGEASKRFYQSHGVPEQRLFFSPYCIENNRFSQSALSENDGESIRAKYGISAGDVCFMFCGKFEDKKHPLTIIQAFRQLLETHQNAHLVMVGDGELRTACELYVEEHKLPVYFAGFVNQQGIPNYYAATDCLVLASNHGETWGLVVNEAMASGLPVIVSSQVGCHLDLITEGQTGWVFEYGNVPDFVAKLKLACDDHLQLRSMGERARERIAGYSPEVAVEGIRQAVESLRSHNSCATK